MGWGGEGGELPNAGDGDLEKIVRGPTKESNWLIPGRFMVGEIPGAWSGGAVTSDVGCILDFGATEVR